MIEIQGYHGTSALAASEIMKHGFRISGTETEWLGKGVYFFVHGISSKPENQAVEWAEAQAWDNTSKRYRYLTYSVIKSQIHVAEENLLDLTTEDGVDILNYILQKHERKIMELGKAFHYLDGLIIDFAKGEGILDLEVVKGNFYIKFVNSRIKRLNLRTPNCTICAVGEPSKNIVSSTIVKGGDLRI